MNMKKYYSQLIGSKIENFYFEEDEYGGSDFPIFILSNGHDQVKFVISQDEEGNGGGFAFIEDHKGKLAFIEDNKGN